MEKSSSLPLCLKKVELEELNSLSDGDESEVAVHRLKCPVIQVFSMVEIFDEILKKISVGDLLRCSLVNKHWQERSRAILRDWKICAVRIRDNETCEALRQLDLLLEDSMSIPFNGLSIRADMFHRRGRRPCLQYGDINIESLYPTIMSLKIKYLRVDWFEFPQCPAWKLVQKILEEQAKNLEVLAVSSPLRMSSLIRRFHVKEFDFKWWLPKLTTFDIELPSGSDFYPLMSEIFSASPKLKEIFGWITPEKLEFLILSKQARNVKELWLCPIPSQLESSINFALESPQLKKLFLSTLNISMDLHADKVSKLIYILILKCCGSLEELRVNRGDFVLLMRELLAVQGNEHPSRELSSKGFPNLIAMELCYDMHFFDCVASLRESSDDIQFRSVRKLRIHQRFQIPCLTSLFPNIRDFELVNVPELASYLPCIWTAWTSIETLNFEYMFRGLVCSNSDAIFCGVTDAEMETLAMSDSNFLNNYHLVPTKPSFRNLSRLKKLRFKFMFDCLTHDSTGKSHFLSEITHLLVFARMSDFSVEWIHKEYCMRGACDDFSNYPCRG